MLTPVFNHLLCFNLLRCSKKVRKLINRPVISLLGTRVSGISTEMITQCIYPKLPATTNRKRLLRNHWDRIGTVKGDSLAGVLTQHSCKPLCLGWSDLIFAKIEVSQRCALRQHSRKPLHTVWSDRMVANSLLLALLA